MNEFKSSFPTPEKLPAPKLNKHFSQSLWHASKDGIIERKEVEKCIHEYLAQEVADETVPWHSHTGSLGRTSILQIITTLIMGKIEKGKLTALQKEIKKGSKDPESQIEFIANGIKASLTDEGLRPEQVKHIQKILLADGAST